MFRIILTILSIAQTIALEDPACTMMAMEQCDSAAKLIVVNADLLRALLNDADYLLVEDKVVSFCSRAKQYGFLTEDFNDDEEKCKDLMRTMMANSNFAKLMNETNEETSSTDGSVFCGNLNKNCPTTTTAVTTRAQSPEEACQTVLLVDYHVIVKFKWGWCLGLVVNRLQRRNWTDAKTWCEQLHSGSLMLYDTAERIKAATDLKKWMRTSTWIGLRRHQKIGLPRNVTEGWKWYSAEEITDATGTVRWAAESNEPRDYSNTSVQDCGAFYKGFMYTLQCSSNLAFICQYKV